MLQNVAEGVWVAHQPLKAGGLVPLGTRMSVLRLSDGGLFLHSPIRRTAELAAAVDALGPVRVITAPNKLHHLFVGDWISAYPSARSYAAKGLPEKRKDLGFSGVWDDNTVDGVSDCLEHVCVRGMPALNEVDFYHRPSRSLVITDLALNFTRNESDSLVSRIYYRLTGAGAGLGQNAVVRMVIKDKARVLESIDRILAWDFQRILLCHGDLVLKDAKAKLQKATDWLRV